MYNNSFGVSKVDERKTAAQEIWTSAKKNFDTTPANNT